MPDVSRQKILIITRNMPPLVGGMERLNWHIADELSQQADVHVVCPKGSAIIGPKGATLSEVPLKPLPVFLFLAFIKGAFLTLRHKPDVILAGSGLSAPLVWLLSLISGAQSAAYLHGFDITVNHGLYKRLWRPTFKKLNQVIVNSTPTLELAINAGVTKNKISIVPPGVTLPTMPQPAAGIAAFKDKHGLNGKFILLSVGRLTTRKGLQEFVERSLPDIVRSNPNTVLVVVGEAPQHSLGAGIQTIESIQIHAEKAGVSGHLRFLGTITEPNLLSTAYEAADVHVFPVRHIPDDPEGFGMVAIEAAAHGLPTVAFATGGVVDAVAHGISGYLVEKDNYAELSVSILRLLRQPMSSEGIQRYAKDFSWTTLGQKLRNTLLHGFEYKTAHED